MSDKHQISKKEVRYDFYIDVITRRPKQVLAAVQKWCRDHGLSNAKYLDKYTREGLTNFSVFSDFSTDQSFIILDVTTKEAYYMLFEMLKNIDRNIHVDTRWGSLEKYLQIEAELHKLELELEAQASKIEDEPEIYQTTNFDKAEEILYEGSKKKVKEYFSARTE